MVTKTEMATGSVDAFNPDGTGGKLCRCTPSFRHSSPAIAAWQECLIEGFKQVFLGGLGRSRRRAALRKSHPVLMLVAMMGTLAWAPASESAYRAQVPENAAPDSKVRRDMPSIRYREGRMDIWVRDSSLGRVMEDVAYRTGLHVVLSDPAIVDWPVRARAMGVSLREGIRHILDGFSYALCLEDRHYSLIIISAPPRPRGRGEFLADVAIRPEHATAAIPTTLDEFRPLFTDEESGVIETRTTGPAEPPEREHREALLLRALDALESEYKQLHAEAIDQLAGLQDFRATEALIEAASSGVHRLQAIGALAQHAAYQQDADVTSLMALEGLAEDKDPDVRDLVRQVLAMR